MRKFASISIGLPLMGLLLISCSKYQSSIEAENACKKWAQEGGEYKIQGVHTIFVLEKPPKRGIEIKKTKGYTSIRPIRWCVEDAKTRKYLGIAYQDAKVGEIVEVQCALDNLDCSVIAEISDEDTKVEKRFGY